MKHITSKHKAGKHFFLLLQCNYQQINLQSWIKSIKYIIAKHKNGRKENFFFQPITPKQKAVKRG